MASNGGNNAEDKPMGGATPVAGDEDEFHHSRGDRFRDDSVEYIGTIKKEMRRVLPHLPDLTLLRLLGRKIRHLFLGLEPGSPSSNPSFGSGTCYVEEVRYEEARPNSERDNLGGKGRGEKGSTTKAPVKSKVTSSRAASKVMVPIAVSGEGTSANLRVDLGPNTSVLEYPGVAEKLVQGLTLLADQEALEKLDLDRAITRLLYSIGRLEGWVTDLEAEKQRTADELKMEKEERAADQERFQKEVALAKESTVQEYKSLDDFHEAVEWAASKFYGEGFDMCKKQIGRLHPELDIQGLQIDAELAKEEEEDEEGDEEKEWEEKGEMENNHPPYRRRWIACGEVLYQAGIDFVHDPELLGDSMHLTMNALKIWSLTSKFGMSNQLSELFLKLDNDLGNDLRKRTNVIGWGESATNPSGVEMRPRWRMESRVRRSRRNCQAAKYRCGRGSRSKNRRLTCGDSTMNLGDVAEMESQGYLIFRATGKVGITSELDETT
ncbi:hypothetical protein Acr_00g0051650 [Actinidia rufa]|uniref:Uncharacterized protein n=1 Tax=Actinidia rufa TaxID=165716 RepID=A0A7J0DMT7_9ERIC|nr:hypothetical protein Acr_00g0051650 [Actinidia rufa]